MYRHGGFWFPGRHASVAMNNFTASQHNFLEMCRSNRFSAMSPHTSRHRIFPEHGRYHLPIVPIHPSFVGGICKERDICKINERK